MLGKAIEHEYNLADLLRRPDVELCGAHVAGRRARTRIRTFHVKHSVSCCEPVIEQIEIAAKYAGYIERQKDEVERAAHYENLKLPADLDYMQVPALSYRGPAEAEQAPAGNPGPGSRISGVTPAAISLLLVHLKKSRSQGFASRRRLGRSLRLMSGGTGGRAARWR